jgi:hypothetical protein
LKRVVGVVFLKIKDEKGSSKKESGTALSD